MDEFLNQVNFFFFFTSIKSTTIATLVIDVKFIVVLQILMGKSLSRKKVDVEKNRECFPMNL